MVDTSGEDNQIILLQEDTDPFIIDPADIEETLAIENVADLLVLVQVLCEEHLHFVLIHSTHGLNRDGHRVAILVAALRGELIHLLDRWAISVDHAEIGQGLLRDLAARIMGFTLVALLIVSLDGDKIEQLDS